MSNKIGKKVSELRKEAGFSQNDIAKALKIPRTAVGMIEKGTRDVSGNELLALSKLFNVSSDYILGLEKKTSVKIVEDKKIKKPEKAEERISVPQKNVEKLKQVLLYILERCAGRPNVGETVMYKLLYFSDFNYYEQYEEQMTGATYKKRRFGPVPVELSAVINRMIKNKELMLSSTEYHGYPQKRYIPQVKAELKLLKASEKDVIDKTIELMGDWTANEISNYSHEDMPWKATEEGESIDYELVFYRKKPYSVREYEEEK